MKKHTLITITLLVALLIGFVAGIGGDVFSRYFLYNFSFLSDLYLPTQTDVGRREVIIQEANRVIVEQENRIAQVVEGASKVGAYVYTKKTGQAVYYPFERVTSALPVTSDGWLVTVSSTPLQAQSLVVSLGKEAYPVTQVRRDSATGLSFIKVDQATLPVVRFAKADSLTAGQGVVSVDPLLGSVHVTSIVDVVADETDTRLDAVRTIELYNPTMILGVSIDAGLPVFNMNGDVVGVSSGAGKVVKIHYINFLLKSLLARDALVKPYLGISYAHTSQISGSSLPDGILLMAGSSPAVSVSSPLVQDLKEGDVIVAVQGSKITSGISFADSMYDYALGDTITLTVVRDGNQFDVKYTLAEQK